MVAFNIFKKDDLPEKIILIYTTYKYLSDIYSKIADDDNIKNSLAMTLLLIKYTDIEKRMLELHHIFGYSNDYEAYNNMIMDPSKIDKKIIRKIKHQTSKAWINTLCDDICRVQYAMVTIFSDYKKIKEE